MTLNRRTILWSCAAAVLAAATGGWSSLVLAAGPAVAVTKGPSCECCTAWIDHLRANGFAVTVTAVDDVAPAKRRLGVPAALESCHTGVVEGYVIEGHVPAYEIKRLLREKPAVVGIAVPGMPVGSPGMEGGRPERYDVIAWRADGTRSTVGGY